MYFASQTLKPGYGFDQQQFCFSQFLREIFPSFSLQQNKPCSTLSPTHEGCDGSSSRRSSLATTVFPVLRFRKCEFFAKKPDATALQTTWRTPPRSPCSRGSKRIRCLWWLSRESEILFVVTFAWACDSVRISAINWRGESSAIPGRRNKRLMI